ncbi:MAG: FAD-binding oxidoreductase [archaeon]
MQNLLSIKLIDRKEEAKGIDIFTFEPSQKLSFLPGQFVLLHATIEGKEIKRAYSIASSPLDEYLELIIEKVSGGLMTTYLFDTLQIGENLIISSPQGVFKYDETVGDEIVMITGGTGIAPMRSIIRYCTEKKLDTKLLLIYSSRSKERVLFQDELNQLEKKNNNFSIRITYTRECPEGWEGAVGRVNEELIREAVSNINGSIFYLCGSVEMINSMVNILKSLNVDKSNIKRDVWGH